MNYVFQISYLQLTSAKIALRIVPLCCWNEKMAFLIYADTSMTQGDSLPSRWWPSFFNHSLRYHFTPWTIDYVFLSIYAIADVWAYRGRCLCVQPLLLEHCGLFFVPLSLAMVNDDSARCKKMASLAIRSLLGQLDVKHQNSMFTLVTGWLSGEKVN